MSQFEEVAMRIWVWFQVIWSLVVMTIAVIVAIDKHGYYSHKAETSASSRMRITTECMQGKTPGCETRDTVNYFADVLLPTLAWWTGVMIIGIGCLVFLHKLMNPSIVQVESTKQ
jgi:predicted aminopeptidase